MAVPFAMETDHGPKCLSFDTRLIAITNTRRTNVAAFIIAIVVCFSSRSRRILVWNIGPSIVMCMVINA